MLQISTGANFQQKRLWVFILSILPLNFPKKGVLMPNFVFVDKNFRRQQDCLTIFWQPKVQGVAAPHPPDCGATDVYMTSITADSLTRYKQNLKGLTDKSISQFRPTHYWCHVSLLEIVSPWLRKYCPRPMKPLGLSRVHLTMQCSRLMKRTVTKNARLLYVMFSRCYNFRKPRYGYCHIRYHSLSTKMT